MVFGENFENKIDNKEYDVDSTVTLAKNELSSLKKTVENQKLGEAEKLPQEQIDNISKFYDTFGDSINFFTIKGVADIVGRSDTGAENKKNETLFMANSLKEKGIVVTPDLSTGNTAQAWLRAMTLIDQLPLSMVNGIKDKIKFDVQVINKTDEKGTYRYASLNATIGGKLVPNIEKIEQPVPEISEEENIEGDDDNTPEIEIPMGSDELQKFESWEGLKKPLGTHMFFRVKVVTKSGEKEWKNYIKRIYYKREDGKLKISSSNWKSTTKKFNDYKELKSNSIIMDMSDTLGEEYQDFIQKAFRKDRVAIAGIKTRNFLNLFSTDHAKFALNHLYDKYNQDKSFKNYITRAQELQVQNKQYLLANNK